MGASFKQGKFTLLFDNVFPVCSKICYADDKWHFEPNFCYQHLAVTTTFKSTRNDALVTFFKAQNGW